MDIIDTFWDNIVAGKDEELSALPVSTKENDKSYRISTYQLCSEEYHHYKGLMLPEITALIDDRKVYGIGAVVEKKPGDERFLPVCAAAGTVVFGMDREPEGIYVNIFWLYVGQDFRGMGVGKQLLEKIRESVKDSGAEFMKLDLPPTEECRELARFLAREGFALGVTSEAECLVTVEEVQDALDRFAGSSIPKGKAISDSGETDIRQYVGKIYRKYSWKDIGYLLNREDDLFDPAVSVAYAENDNISELILVQKKSDKLLSVEFIGDPRKSDKKDLFGVIMRAANAAERIYGPDAEIIIRCRHAETAELLSEIFPDKAMKRVVRAACSI